MERRTLEQNDENTMTVAWQNDGNWNTMMKFELVI